MTIQSETREIVHNGNDVATSFSFSFKVAEASELRVTTTVDDVDTVLVLDTDYSVTLNGDQNASPGGSITYPLSGDPLATGDTLQIDGNDALLQEEDLQTGAGLNPQTLEEMVDRLTRQVQQLQRQIKRAPRMPNTQTALDAFTRSQMTSGGFLGVDVNGRWTIASGTGSATDAGNVTWAANETDSENITVEDFFAASRINVKRFGATGDGTTDDTTALQNALDYASNTGKRLYAPAGTYKFTNLKLDVALIGNGTGPVAIEGDGTPFVQFGSKGTIFRQIDGTTSDAFEFTGDWAGNDYILSLRLRDFGLYCSNASTGWGIDMYNVVGFHSEISNVAVYCPNASAAGAIRMRSCWTVTVSNVRCDGPSSGTTSKGFVCYGEASVGTTNQIVINNLNCVGFGKANVQIGKHDESGGGTTQGIVWNGGQAGSSPGGYGVVIGRVFDYTISGIHTENNSKSGWLLTESANGADGGYGSILNCDSYDDAQDGASDSDGDAYSIHIRRGKMHHINGFRFQETTRGIFVADTTDTTNVELDLISFGGKSNDTDSRTALYVENATPSNTKRVTVGHIDFAYTWGNGGTNVIENGDCLSWRRRTDANAQSTGVATTEAIYPWTEEIALAPTSVGVNSTANNGSGAIRVTTNGNHGIVTGDVVRVWGVKGNLEANSVWVATYVSDTVVDLDGSTYTNAYSADTYDRIGKVYPLDDLAAQTNFTIATNQRVSVKMNSGNRLFRSVANGGNFYLKDGRNVLADDGDVFVFTRRGDYWFEVSRQRNRLYITNVGDNDMTFTVRECGTATSIAITNETQEVVLSQSGATNVNTLSAIGTLSSGGQAVAMGNGPVKGQRVLIRATNGNSTLKDASGGGSAKFRLAGAADLTLGANDTLLVALVGDEWHQVGASNN